MCGFDNLQQVRGAVILQVFHALVQSLPNIFPELDARVPIFLQSLQILCLLNILKDILQGIEPAKGKVTGGLRASLPNKLPQSLRIVQNIRSGNLRTEIIPAYTQVGEGPG